MNKCQQYLFEILQRSQAKMYRPILTASENMKGVLDVDTVKGCSFGMTAYPNGGCYGSCYAAKTAMLYGFDFSRSIVRRLPYNRYAFFSTVRDHNAVWYRIGIAGDPSYDWDNTIEVCEFLQQTGKIPVIVTKHWIEATNSQLGRLAEVGCVLNTSVSGMDTNIETSYRVYQMDRIRKFGMVSVCRIVTCEFGNTEWGKRCAEKQEYLLSIKPTIDTPFRASKNHKRALSGDLLLTKCNESIGGGSKMVSLHNTRAYLGKCRRCPDQCGVQARSISMARNRAKKNNDTDTAF